MNLLDLYAKITMDTSGYEKGLDDASRKASSFSSKLKSGLAAAAKVGAAALTAAAAGVTALTKASIDQYAEYEQLVGGVDTLFKTASDKVQQYAANAYKTAGMSANEYMNTVTSFSASLLQSLGGDTEKAAQKADQAITDMADNANKMGTSMEMIQNAYSGFAKSNFTMLDNLKIGYGGTKEEMQRLLADAEKLSGIKYDISSYADIVDAIHVVQTEMGITGTTAKEAADTISGSLAATKAAWKNLMTGLGDENANIAGLVNNVVDSAMTAAGNIVPRIGQILSGMAEAVVEFAPVIAEKGRELLANLGDGILTEVPNFVAKLPEIIVAFINFINGRFPEILNTGITFLGKFAFGIISAIPDMVGKLPAVISAITKFVVDNFPLILRKGAELVGQLTMGILGAVPEMVTKIPSIITAIVDTIKSGWELMKNAGKYLLEGLWNGIADKIQWLKSKVSGVVNTIKGWFTGKDGFDEHSPSKWSKQVFRYVMEGGGKGLDEGLPSMMQTVSRVGDRIKAGMSFETGSVDFSASGIGRYQKSASSAIQSLDTKDGCIQIVVQSVLDGKVIGEAAYQYEQNRNRAFGV